MKSELAEFIESIGDELEMTDSGKYRFVVSRMEFPPTATLETLKAHYNGRAMRRARIQRANEQYDFSALLPHIVPHKFMNEEKFLFCYLTNKTLPRNAEVVKRHVSGKQYQRRLKESLEKKAELDRIKERRKAKLEKAKEARRKQKLATKNGEGAGEKDDKTVHLNGEKDESNSADNASDSDVDMEEAKAEDMDTFKETVKNRFTGGAESMLADTLTTALVDSDVEDGDSSDDGGDDDEGDAEDEKLDNFWTRGNNTKHTERNTDAMDDGDSDDADEWAKKKKPPAKGKRALARAAALSAGSKRKCAPPVPKKLRQSRRRRNSGGPSTAGEGK